MDGSKPGDLKNSDVTKVKLKIFLNIQFFRLQVIIISTLVK